MDVLFPLILHGERSELREKYGPASLDPSIRAIIGV
jgi:hypothetical protein